jgi:hypothetical protein
MNMKVNAVLTFTVVQLANLPIECSIAYPYLNYSFSRYLGMISYYTYVGLLFGLGMFIATSLYLLFKGSSGANPLRVSLPIICLGLGIFAAWMPLAFSAFYNPEFVFSLGIYFPFIGLGVTLMGLLLLVAKPQSMNTKVVTTVGLTFIAVQLANIFIECWLMLQHPLVFASLTF